MDSTDFDARSPRPSNGPSTMPDLEVVRRVLAGEAALYELVMRRYNRFLFEQAARADDGVELQ